MEAFGDGNSGLGDVPSSQTSTVVDSQFAWICADYRHRRRWLSFKIRTSRKWSQLPDILPTQVVFVLARSLPGARPFLPRPHFAQSQTLVLLPMTYSISKVTDLTEFQRLSSLLCDPVTPLILTYFWVAAVAPLDGCRHLQTAPTPLRHPNPRHWHHADPFSF